MPIYEYKCKDCGHNLEALQKISAAPLTDCPECNKPGLEKLVSAAAFQLKGDGWYVTDFRDKGKPADTAKKESSNSTSSASSSDNSTSTDA